MKRLLTAAMVAVLLMAPGIIIGSRASAACRPLACQGWGIYDWEWWYFECWIPPCEAEGGG